MGWKLSIKIGILDKGFMGKICYKKAFVLKYGGVFKIWILNFLCLAQLVFGRGKAKEVGSYVKSLGNKALIVTGKSSAKKAGYLDLVTKSLEKEGIDWVLFDEIEPNPLTTTIDRGNKFCSGKQS
jgi:alcohol dehydrogenase class IV